MSRRISFRIFAHSWISDWNHGNAHFLRGLALELLNLGHEVRCYEEFGSWSMSHLMREDGGAGAHAIELFRRQFPELDVRFYERSGNLQETLRQELHGAEVVIIHEWNDPALANQILALKKVFGFRALLHDTHHRAYTNAGEILRFPLHLFDGVLAFGEAVTRIYLGGFGMPRAWTFHEGADVRHFQPQPEATDIDVLWIGNWGDEERTRELMEFLVKPLEGLSGVRAVAHGVRYPVEAQRVLAETGIEYRGYLPNLIAPAVYGRSAVSLHVPRRHYTNGLSGVPTIRVFEALACGATLVCSPWTDAEQLFRPDDYIVVNSGEEMRKTIHWLLCDDTARRQVGARGRETVMRRHTCFHRARQLVEICEEITS